MKLPKKKKETDETEEEEPEKQTEPSETEVETKIENVADLEGVGKITAEKLEAAGFNTIEMLACAIVEQLKSLDIEDKQARKIIAAARAQVTRFGLEFKTADQVLKDHEARWRLSTHVKSLDEILGGGFESTTVNTIHGLFGHGKSQMAHWLTACLLADDKDASVLFVDSVLGDNPIALQDERGLIDIRPIEEVAVFSNYKPLERVKPINNFKVWDGFAFEPIHYAYRHEITTTMRRVNVRCGVIDVTPAHSLFSEQGVPIEASKVKVGGRLLLGNPIPLTHKFDVPIDLAWLYGFFVAEGTIRYPRANRKSKSYDISISNKDKRRLSKCEKIIGKYFGNTCHLTECADGVSKISVHECSALARLWLKMFYTYRRSKRVPRLIINATNQAIMSFMQGFQEGDGHRNTRVNYELNELATSSQTVGAVLAAFAYDLGQRPTFFTRSDKLRAIEIRLNRPVENTRGRRRLDSNLVRKIFDFPYQGYVYDLCTASHRFQAGVNVVAHNTENSFRPERLLNFLPTLGGTKEDLARVIHSEAINSALQRLIIEHAGKKIKENNVKLLIIDSATAHFRSEYIDRSQLSPRQQTLNAHLQVVSKLTRMFGLVTLLTNQEISVPVVGYGGGPSTKPVGGPIFGHRGFMNLGIWRPDNPTSEVRILVIEKHPSLPPRRDEVSLTEQGFGEAKEKK